VLPVRPPLRRYLLTFEAFEGSGKTRNYFREVVHFGLYRKQSGFYSIHSTESDASVRGDRFRDGKSLVKIDHWLRAGDPTRRVHAPS